MLYVRMDPIYMPNYFDYIKPSENKKQMIIVVKTKMKKKKTKKEGCK